MGRYSARLCKMRAAVADLKRLRADLKLCKYCLEVPTRPTFIGPTGKRRKRAACSWCVEREIRNLNFEHRPLRMAQRGGDDSCDV